jgi:hypothetical protein
MMCCVSSALELAKPKDLPMTATVVVAAAIVATAWVSTLLSMAKYVIFCALTVC